MKRIWKAFGYSLAGLRAAWAGEAAFREEVLLSFILIPAAFYFAPGRMELIAMVGSIVLVLIVELLNSAVEATVNRIGPEIHPLAKKAKDTASAAVLVALLLVGFVWCICLF
jgi:diacylglycerol kinase (ATP)